MFEVPLDAALAELAGRASTRTCRRPTPDRSRSATRPPSSPCSARAGWVDVAWQPHRVAAAARRRRRSGRGGRDGDAARAGPHRHRGARRRPPGRRAAGRRRAPSPITSTTHGHVVLDGTIGIVTARAAVTPRRRLAPMPVPGPPALGRGVVVVTGAPVPPPWRDAPVVTIDDAVLADPAPTVARLHAAWAVPRAGRHRPRRRPGDVPRAAVDRRRAVAAGRRHRAVARPPALPDLGQHLRRPRRRARVVVGGQGGPPRRRRRGDARTDRPTSCCPTAGPAWVDGGPRSPLDLADAVVHSESVDVGSLAVVPPPGRAASPTWPPTSWPRSATVAGPARVIAPAGRARRGSSPSACATSTSTAATSRRPCSPSPTTSRPSWRWRPAPRPSGRASARSTRSACGSSPSTAAARRRCSTSPRCAG